MLYQDQLRYANLYANPAQQFPGGFGLPSGSYARQFPGGYGWPPGSYANLAQQGLSGQGQQFAASGPFNYLAQQPLGSIGYPAQQGSWGGAQPFGTGEPFGNPAQSSYGSTGIFSHPAQQGPWESWWSHIRNGPPMAQLRRQPADPAQQGLLFQAGYKQPAPVPVSQQQAQNPAPPSGPQSQERVAQDGTRWVLTQNGWVRYDPNDPQSRREALLRALWDGAGDTSAIQHPLQTVARLVQGVAGAILNHRMREEEKRKAELEARKDTSDEELREILSYWSNNLQNWKDVDPRMQTEPKSVPKERQI